MAGLRLARRPARRRGRGADRGAGLRRAAAADPPPGPGRPRPGRSSDRLRGRRAPGGRWLERRVTGDLGDLAELDLAALPGGAAPGFGAPVGERLLLVCTHGKRDACCARYGAPVARELAGRGLPVWETTHLGGDQFAANLACLPDGTYHGLLDRASAADVAAACLRGEVTPAHFRGRAGVGPA
ncbi:sucrase ferredoxin [Catenulispora yoronensis]